MSMLTKEEIARIDQCLHDAEHADSGARMAGVMRDNQAVKRYLATRSNLIAEAHSLDPFHTSNAWEETDLAEELLPAPAGAGAAGRQWPHPGKGMGSMGA